MRTKSSCQISGKLVNTLRIYCTSSIFRSSPERWPNKPGKNVHPYVRTCTIKLNAATKQIVVLYLLRSITTKWVSRSSEVRVKVTWDVNFQKWRFLKSISSAIFQPIKKFQRLLILDQNIYNLSGRIFEFSSSYRVTWLQILPKNRLRPILMKLGMMLEVDETFTTIWHLRWYDFQGHLRSDRQGQGQDMISVPFWDYFSKWV